MTDHVEIQRTEGVATVTLRNGKVNALSRATLHDLHLAATQLTMDPPGAVVITGGPKVFAAGADIAELSGPEAAAEVGQSFLSTMSAVAAIPRATVAAVNGVALGGGCELALACDFRVASSRAKFGQPEILLGVIPGGGGTQRLPRLIGPARAKDLVYSGRQVGADEALAIGLVDEVVEPDEVESRALELAGQFAAGPVVAHGLAKQAIDVGLDGPIDAGLELEHQNWVEAFTTEDAQIGVASFLEHGPGRAAFKGQ